MEIHREIPYKGKSLTKSWGTNGAAMGHGAGLARGVPTAWLLVGEELGLRGKSPDYASEGRTSSRGVTAPTLRVGKAGRQAARNSGDVARKAGKIKVPTHNAWRLRESGDKCMQHAIGGSDYKFTNYNFRQTAQAYRHSQPGQPAACARTRPLAPR